MLSNDNTQKIKRSIYRISKLILEMECSCPLTSLRGCHITKGNLSGKGKPLAWCIIFMKNYFSYFSLSVSPLFKYCSYSYMSTHAFAKSRCSQFSSLHIAAPPIDIQKILAKLDTKYKITARQILQMTFHPTISPDIIPCAVGTIYQQIYDANTAADRIRLKMMNTLDNVE